MLSIILASLIATTTPKLPPPSDEIAVLEYLAMCESSNRPEVINPNDSGSPSYGLLQFKTDTWTWATKRYGYEDFKIMNGEHQKIVARAMLKEGRWKHWRNCLNKIYGTLN